VHASQPLPCKTRPLGRARLTPPASGGEEVRRYGRAPPQRRSRTFLPRRRSRPWLQCSEVFAPARAAHACLLWPSGSWLHCAGIGVLVGVPASGASTDATQSSLAPASAPH